MPTAMVVGTGRSGTTWVAEVIDSQMPCRLMFEPFNPDQVEEYRQFHHFQYMRPEDQHPDLLRFCRTLIAGELRGRWVDSQLAHVAPRFRLIKDIRPTLMLRWLHDRFPQVPVLFLLRHPCAVVLSRLRLNWATDADIQRFLCQPQLVSDYLSPYLEVIETARTDEEKHAVIWSIANLVPLRQCGGARWTIVYYERLRREPESEVPKLCMALGIESETAPPAAVNRPSRTTRHASQPFQGSDAAAWQRDLTSAQINRVLRIVEAFGLNHLYGESAVPLPTAPSSGHPSSRAGACAATT